MTHPNLIAAVSRVVVITSETLLEMPEMSDIRVLVIATHHSEQRHRLKLTTKYVVLVHFYRGGCLFLKGLHRKLNTDR
jgi:hypothetical protein